jgi:hypothetical protein
MVLVRSLFSTPTKRESKHKQIREEFFSGFADKVWSLKTNKEEKGWWTIPRTMPLIMTLLNILDKKGNMSRVYLELWCRAFDEGIVEVTDEEIHAYACGFLSSRGARTWRERIVMLEKLGFIKTQSIARRKYKYILLLHPHKVIASLKEDDKIPNNWYDVFRNRAIEIGAGIPQVQDDEKKKQKKATA